MYIRNFRLYVRNLRIYFMCYAGGVCVPGSRKNLGVSVLPASGGDERCGVRVAG